MTSQMETDKKICALFLLPVLLQVYTCQDCISHPYDGLSCVSDYHNNITCVWNSTRVSDPKDTCTLYVSRKTKTTDSKLEPIDGSRPGLRGCSLFVSGPKFRSYIKFSMKLSCEPLNQILINITYKPHCHIKLNPPAMPNINFTTISWSPRKTTISEHNFQLQWKQEAQSWKDVRTHVRNKTNEKCNERANELCQAELDPDLLERGQRYEARVRVQVSASKFFYLSTWSDWSPTASWVSPVGRATPPPPLPPTDGPGLTRLDAPVGTVVGAVVALLLAAVFFRTDRSTWVYVVKKIRGPPLPNPAHSFLHDANFQFTSESFHFLKKEDIAPIEITNSVDGVAPWGPEAALLDRRRWDSSCQSTNSNYSNPSYSHLCTPPLSSLTGGNLEPCAPDSPYGPVGNHSEGVNGGKDEEEREQEILQLVSNGIVSGQLMQVSTDYERFEKLQAQRCGVQSPDSGMGSGEEVSQESMEEADGINMTGGHGEGLQGKAREEEHGKEMQFPKLFGDAGCGGIFVKGSIQVCSDYERVEQVQTQRPGIQSPDSGMGSRGEEQVSSESLEDVDGSVRSKAFLFPPPSGTFQCFLPSFTLSLPLNLSVSGMSSPLGPLPGHILEGVAPTPSARPLEPSGGGYMPVGAV